MEKDYEIVAVACLRVVQANAINVGVVVLLTMVVSVWFLFYDCVTKSGGEPTFLTVRLLDLSSYPT